MIRNKNKRNVAFVYSIVLASYGLLIIFFACNLAMYSDRWFARPSNTRIKNIEMTEGVYPGSIYDRSEVMIAWNDIQNDGYQRKYHEGIEAIAPLIGMNASSYGRTGLELFYSKYLYGYSQSTIEQLYQAVFLGQSVGSNIHLTIDFDLQRFAYEKLKSYEGAAVVMRADTGEILAMVSSPSFNPEDEVSVKKDSLVNRTVDGLYPPGSVMKIVTVAAALKYPERLKNSYQCQGELDVSGQTLSCYKKKAHGDLTIEQAFAQSCNTIFAQIALDLGEEAMNAAAEELCFNREFLFPDIQLQSSAFPAAAGDENELAWAAIGQGKVLVTPLHMAMLISGIANEGDVMEPKLIYRVTGRDNRVIKKMHPVLFAEFLTPGICEEISRMMARCVNEGTGSHAAVNGVQVYGKTGTAEIGAEKSTYSNDAWFVGYIEKEYPIAIALVIENTNQGNTGGSLAAPIAGEILGKAIQLQQ